MYVALAVDRIQGKTRFTVVEGRILESDKNSV